MAVKEMISEMFEVSKLQLELCQLIPAFPERQAFLGRMKKIAQAVDCPHNESHVLSFIVEVLKLPANLEGCIVEAGAYKGGSTAKLSLLAQRVNRPLYVFDSFEGLPENTEQHTKSLLGHSIEGWFEKGKFFGALEEVKQNVGLYGNIESCQFIQGWFEDTLPSFDQKIAAAYVDVDLAASTRTCLKYLYPKIVPGGILVSQDGDFPLVLEVFKDDAFWENEVGCPKPKIQGLGKNKILKIVKPLS